jgi:hypothetical protein
MDVAVDAAMVGLEMPPPGFDLSRYVVLAGVREGRLHTGDLPSTCDLYPFPWDASYAAFRPIRVVAEPAAQDSSAGLPLLPLLVVAGAGATLAAFLIGWRGTADKPS